MRAIRPGPDRSGVGRPLPRHLRPRGPVPSVARKLLSLSPEQESHGRSEQGSRSEADMAATTENRAGTAKQAASGRKLVQGFGSPSSFFQSELTKERSRQAGAVRSLRISGAQRSAQKQQQRRRDSR